jgi:hypothetical protein
VPFIIIYTPPGVFFGAFVGKIPLMFFVWSTAW